MKPRGRTLRWGLADSWLSTHTAEVVALFQEAFLNSSQGGPGEMAPQAEEQHERGSGNGIPGLGSSLSRALKGYYLRLSDSS